MKKSYKLENLHCANCAAKMENNINKLEGVNATVNFMTQKLMIEAEDEHFEEAVSEAQKVISKIEKDCLIKR
ncbi:MAG: cation transporter [Clostridia bacterium]|nr:cation transporter [Clostridia bacterium]